MIWQGAMFGPQLSSHSSSASLNPLLEVLIALLRRGDGPMRIQKGNIPLSSLPQAKWDLDVNKVLANASEDLTRKLKPCVRYGLFQNSKVNRQVRSESVFVIPIAADEVMLNNLENSASPEKQSVIFLIGNILQLQAICPDFPLYSVQFSRW